MPTIRISATLFLPSTHETLAQYCSKVVRDADSTVNQHWITCCVFKVSPYQWTLTSNYFLRRVSGSYQAIHDCGSCFENNLVSRFCGQPQTMLWVAHKYSTMPDQLQKTAGPRLGQRIVFAGNRSLEIARCSTVV